MANKHLDEFRKQYPIYKDIDDDTLSEGIRQTYYSDISEEDYKKKLDLGNYLSKEEEDEITSKYKTTTPDSWAEKIKKDASNVGDSVSKLFEKNDISDIASEMTNSEDKAKIPLNQLLPNQNIETPKILMTDEKALNEQEPTTVFGENIKNIQDSIIPLANRVESSLKQFSNKTAIGIDKALNHILNNIANPEINGDKLTKDEIIDFANTNDIALDKNILENIKNEEPNEFKEYIKPIDKLEQQEADFTSNFTKEQRDEVNKNMQTIHDTVNNGELFEAFKYGIKELPGILADSSGEIVQLLTLPTSALAINARVMDFEEDYIKNNDGKRPDKDWYEKAYLSQSALLLAERFGIKKAGEIALKQAPKIMKGAMIVGGGAGFEATQEVGEGVSEDYLTQKDGENTLLEIAQKPERKTEAFLGALTGGTLAGAGVVTSKINSAVSGKTDEDKKQEIEDNLLNALNNTTLPKEDITNLVNTNQAYYQQQSDNVQAIEDAPAVNKQLEQVTDGFAKLQEDIKANNELPLEQLIEKDLEVKVKDEPVLEQEEIQNNINSTEDINSQTPTLETKEILENKVENIPPQIDENSSIPDEINPDKVENTVTEENVSPEINENIINDERIKQVESLLKDNDKDIEVSSFIKSDDFKKVISDIDSEKEILFKPLGNNQSIRGKLVDLPFGHKGVVTYHKDGGIIYEHSTGSRGFAFGKGSSTKNELEAYMRMRNDFISRGEEYFKEGVDKIGVINPNIIEAKNKILDSATPKKGQIEFTKSMNGDSIEKDFGYPVKLPYGIEAFVHKTKDGWRVTEKRSGLGLGFEKPTRTEAIKEATSKIEAQTQERMEASISTAERNKLKVENEYKAIEDFDNIGQDARIKVLKDIYKSSNITDKEIEEELNKDLSKTLIGAITENYIDNNFSFDKYKETGIIKQDNKEVEENGNINSTTEDGATGDVQGDVLDTTRGNESSGVQSTTQDEQTIESSNQDITTNDTGPKPTNETGNDTTTSKRDSNTQSYSGDVKLTNDSFTLNQERLYDSGEVSRFNSNIKAIKLIKENKTFYTDEEKQIISSYTGFGGIQKAFQNGQGKWVDGWQQRGEELKILLTADEYKAAERGILDAFYTPLPTIKTMWSISNKLGFKGGLILEPSIGTGRFIGMTPDNLKLKTSFNGIELDPMTYKVAKALYSKVNLRNRGFEETNYDSNHDMVIGNPPYGEFKLYDKYNKEYNSLSAHNYFIVKSLDALKEGGILNFVISSSFLDNIDSKTSQLINSKAKFVGAIRLPSDIFKGAGTNVTTDIVLFQKLKSGETGNIDIWNKKSELNGYKINQYFIDNEAMLLGDWVKGFRNNGKLIKSNTFEDDLQFAINKLPDNIMDYDSNIAQENISELAENSIPENIMYIRNNKVFVNISQKGILVPEEVNMKKEKAEDYIKLKESLKNIINMQLDINTDDKTLQSERKNLNNNYDNFVKKHGALNKTQNRSQIVKDRDGYLTLTLEEDYKQEIKSENKRGLKPRKESFTKADILTKRTITPQQEIKTSNSEEALIFSLNTKGLVDAEYISKITGKQTNTILEELKGKIFYDNDLGYVTRDVFLSGDVKTKFANTTDEYAKEELKKVIPKDVEAKDIKTEFGQNWIDKKYFSQFIEEKMGFQRYKLSQSDITSSWFFEGYSYSFPYKASKVKDEKIVLSALNSKQIRVTYKGVDDKTYLDQQATDYANTQVEKLKEDFEDWIFRDTQRREYLVKKYNEVKNRYVSLDDTKISDLIDSYNIPNISHFEPRPHQKKAVYKAVFSNSPLLLNHTVGSGKTLTSQMIAMEWRRLGKAKKPLIATLKAVVPQFAKEFKEAYPNAKIIVPNDSDFTPVNRKRLLSSIATGDYDAVIITHDQLKMIENPAELQSEMIETEIDDVMNAIKELESMKDGESNKTKRELIKKQEALEKRYEALKDSKKDLDVLSFDKLGIDGLIIDESHKFKKLAYSSSLGQIKGMPDQKGSKMAFDLYVKTQHILNTTNSKNIVFMTGTPITNTVPELYLIQKYLQNDLLKKQGISNFDSYAKDYISQSTEVEITATGGFKEVTRIKEFKNMPMLIQSTQQIIDTVTNEDIKKSSKNFKLPALKDGKPTLVFLEPTKAQLEYNDVLVERVTNMKKDSKDNHLVIFNDASKMSIDMRLVSDSYADENESKINAVVNRAFDKYKEFDNAKGTQLIFSDLGTPKSDKDKINLEKLMAKAEEGDTDAIKELENYNDAEIDDILNGGSFSVYDDIKRKLIKKGIPSNEVVFIHDFNTKEKKIELNQEVRAGKIRVVIGSTQKLGTGINVQERLVSVHHIDIPYTPAELEQRNGRIIRQGNKLIDEIKDFNIEIFYYATKRTLDGMKWQILENKAKFIQQFFDGVSNDDIEIEEMSNSELAERMKAEASGNPLLIDKIKLEKQIKKLRNLKRGAELAKSEKKARLKSLETLIKDNEKNIINYEKDSQIVKDNLLLIEDKHYEKPSDLGNAVYDIAANLVNKKIKTTQKLGNIGDIELSIFYDIYSDKVKIDFTGNILSKIEYEFINETPLKIANSINRKIASYELLLENNKTSLKNLKKEQTELLKNEDKPFEKEKELEDLVSEHSNIIQTISKQATGNNTPNNKENENSENDTSYMKSKDEAMPNNPDRLTGKKSDRPTDSKFTLKDKEVSLPDKYSPMTPAKIRKQIIDIIGNRLYFSKIKQKAEGYYKKKTGETRIKDINNVEVYAHEMAHYLDFYKGNNTFKKSYQDKRFKNEVESFSYTKNEDQKSFEGFAEYLRAWLTQYDFAKAKAPNYTKEFESIIKEVGLETKLNELQENMHIWYKQGDEAMFSALIGEKKSKLDSLKETIFNIKHSVMNKFIVNIFDRTHGFSIAEFAMFNKLQKAEQSPTKLLRLAIGGSSATYEAVIKWGTPKLTANGDLTFSGKGLADIFEPIVKKGANEFKSLMEYFAAVQANEMQLQGKKTPFSESQIETVLQRGEANPEFKRVFKEYQDFNNRMLDFYVDMDYLTPQDVENFRDKNSVYVPMQRIVESMGEKDGYAGGFFTRKGSDRNIRDIEKNITEQLYHHIKGAMVAHAKSKLFSQLSRHEDGSLFAVRLSTDTKKIKVGIEQQAKKIVEILYSSGMMIDETGSIIEIEDNVSLEDVMDNTIDVLIDKPHLMSFMTFGNKPKNTGSNIEEVIIDGEKRYFEIQNGELGDVLNITLNNLGGLQYNWFMAALYAIKNFKTRAITAMPQFKLPNFIRDTLDAQVFRKTKKPINPLAGAKSYFAIDDAFKNYMLNGGGYGTLLEATNPSKPQDIFKESGLQKFDRLMSFDEYSNRIRVAENAIQEGNNWLEASYQGRDLTVDFSMVGSNKILRSILRLIPFQQAAMNGMYKLVREIKDEGHNPATYAKAVARLSIKGFTYLTPIAMISYMMSEDDDRYKSLTSDELARFIWFFYDKNEQPIKIPVPFGLGAIFQKFPEYLVSSLFSDGDFVDNRYSEAIKFAFVNQLLAVPNAGIFDPIFQDLANKKFTGAPIVSPELQKVEPYLQYTNNTPLFYKELGSATGLSPLRLEHYTKGMLGYIESAISGMTQMALWDKDKWGEMPYSSTGDYAHSTFFKQFYKMNETSRTAWSEEYFKYRQKIDEAYNSLRFSNKQIIKDKGSEYEKYISNKDKVTLTSLKTVTASLDKINAELASIETAITFNKDLTAKEKEKQLEDIYKEKTKIFKEVYKQINPIVKEVK